MTKEVEERGHPLLWGEWKPVTLLSTLIRDFHVAEVVDLTPGSGAACLAALYSHVHCTGVPYNAEHEKWLLEVLHRTFIALVVEDKVRADKDLTQKVQQYLPKSVETAKRMLPKDSSAIGDSLTGDDDSDIESQIKRQRTQM